jgi:hypothetical protein
LSTDTAGDEALVYFIQSERGGPIKIGRSTRRSISARLSTLRSSSPANLVVRRLLEGGAQAERELHERFSAFRLHGEWFHPDAEIAIAAEAIDCEGDLHVSTPLGDNDRSIEHILGCVQNLEFYLSLSVLPEPA